MGMFRHQFQGGPFVEVFSAANQSHFNRCSVSSCAERRYDHSIKSYVLDLRGIDPPLLPVASSPSLTASRFVLPKEAYKTVLHLEQPVIVIQALFPSSGHCSVEIVVRGERNATHRLLFSTAFRQTSGSVLHSKVSLHRLSKNNWINVCFCLPGIMHFLHIGTGFRSVDSVTLTGSCILRRVFTLKDLDVASMPAFLYPTYRHPSDFHAQDMKIEIVDESWLLLDRTDGQAAATPTAALAQGWSQRRNDLGWRHVSDSDRSSRAVQAASPPTNALNIIGQRMSCTQIARGDDRRSASGFSSAPGSVDSGLVEDTSSMLPHPPRESSGGKRRPNPRLQRPINVGPHETQAGFRPTQLLNAEPGESCVNTLSPPTSVPSTTKPDDEGVFVGSSTNGSCSGLDTTDPRPSGYTMGSDMDEADFLRPNSGGSRQSTPQGLSASHSSASQSSSSAYLFSSLPRVVPWSNPPSQPIESTLQVDEVISSVQSDFMVDDMEQDEVCNQTLLKTTIRSYPGGNRVVSNELSLSYLRASVKMKCLKKIDDRYMPIPSRSPEKAVATSCRSTTSAPLHQADACSDNMSWLNSQSVSENSAIAQTSLDHDHRHALLRHMLPADRVSLDAVDMEDDTLSVCSAVKPAPDLHHYHREMTLLGVDFDLCPSLLGALSDVGGGERPHDDEEELDLLYDSVLNVYYDPKTLEYYQLA